jgi:hypothetical protein
MIMMKQIQKQLSVQKGRMKKGQIIAIYQILLKKNNENLINKSHSE